MRTNFSTAFMATTATAVAFAYAAKSTIRTFSMWSPSTVKHSNKRISRQPIGVVS